MPPIHLVTYSTFPNFIQQFGHSSAVRQRMARQLEAARHSLYRDGAVRIYVGGSFIDSKPNPHDLDLVVLLANQFNPDPLDNLKKALKPKGLDITFCFDVQSLSRCLSFFGYNREGNTVEVIELIDPDLPAVRLLLDSGYMTDSIYAFKLAQSQNNLQKANDAVERQAIEQYIIQLQKDYRRNSVLAFYQQCLSTEVTMPGKQGEADLQTNSLIGLFLQQDKDFTLVDFGCGQGRLIAVLASLDETILNNLSYIGVDFDTARAEAFSTEKKFERLCKSVRFTSVDQFYQSQLAADYIVSINVVHEVPAQYFYSAVYLPVFQLNADGCFVIHDMEQLPFGEAGFVPWKGDLLRAFFQEFGLAVSVRRHPSNSGTPLYSLVIKPVPTLPISKLEFDRILLPFYYRLLQHYQQERKTKNISERLYGYYSVVIANISDNIAMLDSSLL